MNAQDRSGPAADRGLYAIRVDVVRCAVYVNEYGHGAAISNGIGAGDKGVADRDDLAARDNADCP
jgi:hypothetical protein